MLEFQVHEPQECLCRVKLHVMLLRHGKKIALARSEAVLNVSHILGLTVYIYSVVTITF